MNKKIVLKLLIFVVSFVGSIIVVELGFRFFLNKINNARVYHDVKEYNTYEDEENGKNEYFRDRTFEIYKSSSKIEVLCFGDSFTNAGNTFFDNSYPFQLYKMLQKKITVRNLGVCSSTTSQVAKRFEDFIRGKEFDKSKKYFAVFLMGSADLFTKNLVNEKVIDLEKFQKWQQIDNSKSFANVSESYFLKMVKILYNRLSDQAQQVHSNLFDSIGFNSSLSKCKETDRINFANCLLFQLKNEQFKQLNQGLKEHLIIRKVFGTSVNNSKVATHILQDFILLIKSWPQFAERDYLVMNLVGLVEMQSIVTYDDLYEVLSKVSYQEKSKKFNITILENTKSWIKDFRVLDFARTAEWKRIQKLSKENNISIIVMNYPLPYKSTNRFLENMSKDERFEFINLEKLFSNRPELIDDWEHCSPKGYELVSHEVAKYIK